MILLGFLTCIAPDKKYALTLMQSFAWYCTFFIEVILRFYSIILRTLLGAELTPKIAWGPVLGPCASSDDISYPGAVWRTRWCQERELGSAAGKACAINSILPDPP